MGLSWETVVGLFIKENTCFGVEVNQFWLSRAPYPPDRTVCRTLFLRQLEALVCLASSTELTEQIH